MERSRNEREHARRVSAGQQHDRAAEVPVPEPGHGEVLLRMKASTICGSDIRCIYHEHLGKGPEGYQGVVAGHEPVRADRQDRAGLPPLRGGRPRDRLSHLRLRRLQRLPPRLHDLLHQREVPPRLRLAARRRHGRLPAGRGEGPRHAARRTLLRRRRAGGLRLRHGVRGAAEDRHQRQRRRADHRTRSGRPRHRGALPQARRATRSSASTSSRSAWNWRSTWASATRC